MKVCVLYSGGKDSNLALLRVSGEFKVECLVTLIPRSEHSYLFHYPNTWLTRLQAEALALPLVSRQCPDDEEGSIKALRAALEEAKRRYGVDGVVTGAVKSMYQARKFREVCSGLGLECINPLWGLDEESLLTEVWESGIEAIFTRVAGYPLRKDLLGRRIDPPTIEILRKYSRYINPSGEGGEYETLVLDMPLFRKRLEILECEATGSDYDATLIITRVELVEKAARLR